jgi:ABC-2 type transport system ATP-binding protein
LISAKNLTKFFGEKCAVKDVSFEVEKGEILGFLGPNAAGKSTTMRILTGYFPPTSGTATVAGFDILENSLEARRKVGYLPENFPLYKDMRVSEFLAFVATIKGIPRSDRKASISGAMEKCGLTHEADNFIGRLSKGYCQRVGIAQAIINNPDVLILDEPTVGLDPNQIIEIRNLIKELAGKSTVIISSHILPEVAMVCQRVIIINKGQILTVDTPENLSQNLQKSERIYLEVQGNPEKIKKLIEDTKGVIKVSSLDELSESIYGINVETELDRTIRKEMAQKLVTEECGLFEMHTKQLTLEEIFIQMVDKGGEQN